MSDQVFIVLRDNEGSVMIVAGFTNEMHADEFAKWGNDTEGSEVLSYRVEAASIDDEAWITYWKNDITAQRADEHEIDTRGDGPPTLHGPPGVNRVALAITAMRERVAALSPETAGELERSTALSPAERIVYLDTQANAHATGSISLEEANMLYEALHFGGTTNNGWNHGTDLATKIVVTQVIGELIGKMKGSS